MRRNKRFRPRAPSRGRRRIGSQRNGNRMMLNVPKFPTLHSEVCFKERIFYNQTTAGNIVITRNDILNMMVFPTSSGTASGLLKACRIVAIKGWTIVSNASIPIGHNSDMLVIWHSNLGREQFIRGTQMGISPAYIQTRPPMKTLAGEWTSIASDLAEVIVTLSGVIGTAWVITWEAVLCNSQTPRSFSIVLGTVGTINYSNFADLDPQGYISYTPI